MICLYEQYLFVFLQIDRLIFVTVTKHVYSNRKFETFQIYIIIQNVLQ